MLFVSLRDLQWRRRRFLIGVLATGLVFGLALVISGISGSFHNEIGRSVRALRVDQWIVPADVSGPFTSTKLFPESEVEKVRSLPGVQSAEPVALFRTTARTNKVNDVNLIGIRPNGAAVPTIVAGRGLRNSGDIVVDKSLGSKIGDHLVLAGKEYQVVGQTDGLSYFAGTPVAFVPLSDLQSSVLGGAPLATAVVVRGSVASAPAGFHALSNSSVEQDLARPMKKPTQTIDSVRLMLWVVAAGIIGSLLYLQAIERTRDFAVFKAIGVTTKSLLWGLIAQAVVLTIGAAVTAVIFSILLTPVMSMKIEIPTSAYVALPIVAVIVGLLSSIVALRRAVSVDPAQAFG